MIELMSDLPEYALGVRASGEVSAEDYRKVLVPALEDRLKRHVRVRLLYELSPDFSGYTGGAAWEDAKVGMKHLTSFQRVAVVSDVESVRTLVRALGFAVPGEVRVFPRDQLAAAREWITEPPSQGRLSIQLDREAGVLLLEPHGELLAEDFERVTAEVDPYLAAQGTLTGVAIVAAHFPGWEDVAAFGAHLRFVRDHKDKVRRVALVTDDRLASVVPRIARLFASADVRAFALGERELALAWVAGR